MRIARASISMRASSIIGNGFDTIFNGASLFVCLKHQILAMENMRGAMIIIASAPEAIADAILFLCSSSASMNADGSSP
jgi:hypothetical protein